MEYFRSERLSPCLTRIVDLAGVACYLAEGKERACLLDTCCGYGNIREFVGTLTDKEPFVILSHGHYDHKGGAALFREVYMNERDREVLRRHTEGREEFLQIDRETLPALRDITMEDLNPLDVFPRPIRDLEVFDLGGLHIQMIPVRGHTPGMMCPLLIEERTILFGDACGMNVLLHDEFSSVVSEYLQSLLYLKTFEDQYDTVYRNHGSYTNQRELLDNVIACCRQILAGEDDHAETVMMNRKLYKAKTRSTDGNVIYAEDKAR